MTKRMQEHMKNTIKDIRNLLQDGERTDKQKLTAIEYTLNLLESVECGEKVLSENRIEKKFRALKELYIESQTTLVKARVPEGYCPYCYYSIPGPEDACDNISCADCWEHLIEKIRKQAAQEAEDVLE